MRPCPICGELPRESFQSKHLQVLQCGNPSCGHLYAANAPPDHGVQEHADPRAEREKYWERDKRLVRYWSEQGFLDPDSKVLDFGAGSGHIASAIREFLGVSKITCIEADPLARQWLDTCGLAVAQDLEQCPSDFTSVLLVELIEHVEAPIALLQKIRHHMAPAGKLFLTTPCGETRSGNRRTNAYDTPEHVHFFTERSLRLALSKAGFRKFQFLVVPALYPRGKGVISAGMAYLKGIARRIHSRLFGYSHLVVMIE